MEYYVLHDIHIHVPGAIMVFREIPNELYYYNTFFCSHSIKISAKVTDYLFVNTVEGNNASYTQCQITGADNTITFNIEVSYLRPQKYVYLLYHFFRNCPITSEDVKHAIDIYG